MFKSVTGLLDELLKIKQAGVLSRHRHAQPVHGWVIKGKWHYLEHDWMATEGSYVFEPPGETLLWLCLKALMK